jgi:hypothetical protein
LKSYEIVDDLDITELEGFHIFYKRMFERACEPVFGLKSPNVGGFRR